MTLDEAIKHTEEKYNDKNICKECREEHLQLHQWLTELKCITITIDNITIKNNKLYYNDIEQDLSDILNILAHSTKNNELYKILCVLSDKAYDLENKISNTEDDE